MSEFDIMPYSAAGGQFSQIGSGRVDATATFLRGEPVEIDVDGSVIEASDEPSVTNYLGSTGAPAAIGGKAIGIALAGAVETGTNGSSDGTQATAQSEGVQVPYAQFHRGDLFVVPAERFTEADDTTFDGTVAAANVGDLCSLRTAGGIWGICVHTSSENRNFSVYKLLDANGEDAVAKSTTITQIVIRVEG